MTLFAGGLGDVVDQAVKNLPWWVAIPALFVVIVVVGVIHFCWQDHQQKPKGPSPT